MRKNNNLTLENIAKLIDERLDIKLAKNNVAIFGEMGKIHQEIAELRNETTKEFVKLRDETAKEFANLRDETAKEFTSISGQLEKLRKEMNERFDFVDTQFQNVLQAAADITDQKLEKFRQKYFTA